MLSQSSSLSLSFICLLLVLFQPSRGELLTHGSSGEEMQSALTDSNNFLFNLFFPVEDVPNRTGRPVEWYKNFKEYSHIPLDIAMTENTSVEISRDIITADYTVSALVAGYTSDDIWILIRRQDLTSGHSGFSQQGVYDRLNEGAIPIECVLHFNLTSKAVNVSFGKDIFYYPNAMERELDGNFWFSDAARHQVLRMRPGMSGPDVQIGNQFAQGSGTTRLCAPNDISITSRFVYVADGMCNNRVVMFTKDGAYVHEFGTEPLQRMLGLFNLDRALNQLTINQLEHPQAIAVDEQTDRLYVADVSKSRVLLVKAGSSNPSLLGTAIRSFQRDELSPRAGGIALHPSYPYVFFINSFSTTTIHRGFTFNTHDASFKGAWSPDRKGFVRPRALTVSADGTSVYVADATEQTPESLYIFKRGESPRSRRNVLAAFTSGNQKGDPAESRTSGESGLLNRGLLFNSSGGTKGSHYRDFKPVALSPSRLFRYMGLTKGQQSVDNIRTHL